MLARLLDRRSETSHTRARGECSLCVENGARSHTAALEPRRTRSGGLRLAIDTAAKSISTPYHMCTGPAALWWREHAHWDHETTHEFETMGLDTL